MNINMLLEEAPFNLEGNRVKSVGRNFDKAQKMLNTADKKEMEKLKTDKAFVGSDRGEALLTALNIMAKIGHKMGSGYGADKIDAANQMLGKLNTGFPDDKKELTADPFYKKSRKAFNDVHERQNPGAEVKKEKIPDEKIAQKKPENTPGPAAEIAQKEPEDETPETEGPEVKEPTYDTTDEPRTMSELKDLKARTEAKIQEKIKNAENDKSVGGKMRFANTERVLKSYQNNMDKLIRKANAGPVNARDAFTKADSKSKIAEIDATKAGLKGAVGRTIMKGKEMATAVKQAGQKVAGLPGKFQGTETAKKISDTYKKVSGNIKQATEKGLETALDKENKSSETKPIKTTIDNLKTKTSDAIGKAKETTKKVLGTAKELGTEVKTGTEMAVDATKKAAMKGVEAVKQAIPKKKEKIERPPEGITIKPSTQENLSPGEEEKQKEKFREVARKAKKRKIATSIKPVRGVRRIS